MIDNSSDPFPSIAPVKDFRDLENRVKHVRLKDLEIDLDNFDPQNRKAIETIFNKCLLIIYRCRDHGEDITEKEKRLLSDVAERVFEIQKNYRDYPGI